MKNQQKQTKQIATLLVLTVVSLIFGEHLWYQSSNGVQPVYPLSWENGTVEKRSTNPDTTGDIETVTRIVTTGNGTSSITFKLPNVINDLSELSIKMNFYIDSPAGTLSDSEKEIRLSFSGEHSTPISIVDTVVESGVWEELTFDFFGETSPAQEFDLLTISLPSGTSRNYYIDYIKGTQIQSPAKVLGGNWGITFDVSPAKGSDYDYAAGAREIVSELNTIGHVITNFTGFAHGQYFTLHTNPNVDIATEIHESSVPGIENDHVMEEVLSIFREAGIKTILYMALDGYHNFNATDEQKAAWENYYTTKFGGDEYAAYKDLMMGFVERTKDMCDGYWLDHTTSLAGNGTTTDFVAAIREIHPDAMISLNDTKAWLMTGPQQWVKVDSDGLDDDDTTDYLIVTHESRNFRSDFTSGHVTPIGQGAPVNSWAYEEFTIPNMIESPWTTYNDFTSMKHAWFPVRERWHVPTVNLVQEVEQAYRFVRRVTDAGAAITWATTAEYRAYEKPGHLMPDELEMMKEINRRMAQTPKPEYEPYVRPEGAYLVGEEPVTLVAASLIREKPVQISFVNNALHFNQTVAAATVFTANGRLVANIESATTAIPLEMLSNGIYIVDVQFDSGVKHNFKCMLK